MTNDADFQRALAETIAWCTPRFNPSDTPWCLRTVQFAPYPFHSNPKYAVEDVVKARSGKLALPAVPESTGLHGGHLFAFEPAQTLSDGLAQAETNGFLDGDNCPPWDTWVAFVEEAGGKSYLVSWVPPAMLDGVDNGILVNPEGSIWWIDGRPTVFPPSRTYKRYIQ